MVSAAVRAQLQELLDPVVAGAGADLEDVQVRAAGRRSVVEVVVDRDGGITLDDVAEISRVVSEALDETDLLGNAPYTLEVGSPGVGRPLTLPRHWRRAKGRLVKATVPGRGTLLGRLTSIDDVAAVLDCGGKQEVIALGDVSRAVVEVEFGRQEPDEADEADETGEPDETEGDA